MEIIRFLFLNFNGSICQHGNCRNLPHLIRQKFPEAIFLQAQTSQDFHVQPDLEGSPDIIFLPLLFNGTLPFEAEKIRGQWPGVCLLGVICDTSPQPDLNNSKTLIGLDDFVCCPILPVDIELRVLRHVKTKRSVSDIRYVSPEKNPYTSDGLIGESPTFRKALNNISIFSQTEAPVLVSGETGTGKELFARAIHYHGVRQGKPFVPINCGALPDHLFENEMFGHAKGAFTDAASEQKGLIQEAESGTLFLDEVDALSPSAQIKLLRFLQDGSFHPLGSPKSLVANVRILAATNVDLRHLVDQKKFRVDLYFRLNVLSLSIPPLRDRLEDIPQLAEHFLIHYSKQRTHETPHLSSNALSKLMTYLWPGNVRELEAVIQRGVMINPATVLYPPDIDLPSSNPDPVDVPSQFRQAKLKALDEFERIYLSTLLTQCKGNVSRAAKTAGKERRSFQRLIKKHGLNRTAFTQF